MPHTHIKCGLRFPPQYHISQNLNVLWVQKRNPNMLSFSLKESRQANPLQVPQRGPYGEKYPLAGHFYLSLKISHFIFPSVSPVRVPPPCSLTGSPWAAIFRHQSHSFYFSFMHPSIHSFIYVCRSPRKGAFQHTCGENTRSPYTEHHVDGRHAYNIVRPGSPRCSLRRYFNLANKFSCVLTFIVLYFIVTYTTGMP